MHSRTCRTVVAALAAAAALAILVTPCDAGWLAGWDCRQEISVNPSVTPGDLTSFPLLVKIANPANDLFTRAAAGGLDIAFTKADGVSVLSHEVEHFSAGGAKELDAWVKTDVSSSAPTKLYMYYSNPDGLDHQDAANTWDASYKMVQHLQETAGTLAGSTQYANNGAAVGTPTLGAAGKISAATAFDQSGGDDYISVPDSASLSGIKGGLTVEYWVNRSATSGGYHVIKHDAFGTLKDQTTGGTGYNYWTNHEIDGSKSWGVTTSALTVGDWHHVVSTWEAGNKKVFIDGVKVAEQTTASTNPLLQSGSSPVIIGNSLGWHGADFQGTIDEVRLSDTARDATWVEASFNNQDNPSAYQTAAPAETKGAWLDGWTYRQPITISKDATNANLTDFPLLVQIKDVANGVFAHAGGQDIVFTNGDGVTVLNREVEHFSTGGSPELAAWVSTDLSASEDTLIYMYYGGPDRPNATGTWDPNFRMVQHLQETSGTVLDSTQYGNNGTPHNGVTQNAAGLIGGGDAFNGIANGQYIAIPDSNFGITGGEPFTMEAWCNVYDDGVSAQNQYILSKTGSIGVRVLSGGSPQVGLHVEGGGGWGGGPDIMGDWHHMTVVYDPDLGKIFHYLDGALIREMTQTNDTANGGTYYIATWATTYGFVPGTLDEVRISDIARDADWVLANYRLQLSELGYLDFGAEQIPEPTTMALLALGGLALLRRRRRRA